MDEQQRSGEELFERLNREKKQRRRKVVRTVIIVIAVIALALVLLVLVFVILSGKVRGNFPMFTLAVILGGGVGNLIDRIYRGFVVDYIHLKVIKFAVFNFADICVTLGTAALICWLLFGRSREEADGKKAD